MLHLFVWIASRITNDGEGAIWSPLTIVSDLSLPRCLSTHRFAYNESSRNSKKDKLSNHLASLISNRRVENTEPHSSAVLLCAASVMLVVVSYGCKGTHHLRLRLAVPAHLRPSVGLVSVLHNGLAWGRALSASLQLALRI